MRRKGGRAGKLIFWTIVLLGTVLLFNWVRDAARLERGYEAFGGEWLLWLLPVLLWIGMDTAGEIGKGLKKTEKRAEEETD